MPSRKTSVRGIVKSGNAGNSSKTSSSPTPTPPDPAKEKPLFPPGSKFPLSLLNERCQKNGWEKPEVNTRQHPNGFSFAVILRRRNKKTSEIDIVRLEPHPPFCMPSALEARHWGATYALYRVCNKIQLNRVLPPGPREYWMQLEQEHKAAPEHLKWMYDPDPFAAKKEVEARQDAAAKRREEGPSSSKSQQGNSGVVGGEFVGAVEVKMSEALREFVESAIKKTHDAILSSSGSSLPLPTSLSQESDKTLSESLNHLSFTPPQIARTLSALSTPSPLTTSLLSSTSNPLDAAISHLLLCVPECDLPPRFLARGAGESFVQSAHKGTENLKTRWILERAIKEAGYPEYIVRPILFPALPSQDAIAPAVDWPTLIDKLGQKLIGGYYNHESIDSEFDTDERDFQRSSEIAALESVYPSVTVDNSDFHFSTDTLPDPETVINVSIPVPNTPLTLHMVLPAWHPYPVSTRPPPMYVSANTDARTLAPPSYIRLHILSAILGSPMVKDRDSGEGVGLVAAGIIEEEYEKLQSEGPPDIADVLQHLLFKDDSPSIPSLPLRRATQPSTDAKSAPKNPNYPMAAPQPRAGDDLNDAQILADFERTKRSERHQSLSAERTKLPAWTAKSDFLNAFKSHRVVVCVGETGSGKTTQVPQFILDDCFDSAVATSNAATLDSLQIIVTQPRRVAAISVASRVSAERGDDGSVAYTIRGESSATRRTKLLFCTTGVVLRRLSAGDGLDGVGVVVVDEVHERSVDSDFLLLELRELLKKDGRLKVVLMSATINHQTFVDYFGGAALVTIPGRTFAVQDSYLEDIIPRISYTPPFTKPAQKQSEEQLRVFRQMYEAQGMDSASIRTIEAITRAERIDYQLVAASVAHITANSSSGAILIFMPGVQEIRQCIEALKNAPLGPIEIFPLHANLSSDDQKAVFRTTTKRKIVVSTNVAETSITINDIVYVIDTGKVKETSYDPETGLSRLTETWITQAAARQRRGRAGRTQPGECYKLFTRKQEDAMGQFPVPEMLRVPLESLSLALFLGRAIDPPQVAAMEKAWAVLQELGAIDHEGNLTALGRHMSLLPVDLRLAKMLILGSIFGCVNPILTFAACLSCKPLFFSPVNRRDDATQARLKFSSADSDLLTDAHAYDECVDVLNNGGNQALWDFCEENFISPTTIRDITSLRADLSSALLSAGFIVSARISAPHPALLKSIIMAGLYPRIARITLPPSAIKFDKVQAGAVQRAQAAKEFKIFDLEPQGGDGRGERVFLHPSSVLFARERWHEPFVCYFRKTVTTKPFLRDVTEVPLFALLLFGGPIVVNHIGGGVAICGPKGSVRVKMKAWPRIGVLANQLRRLLDEQLAKALEATSLEMSGEDNLVVEAMLALLTKEGVGG